MKALRAGTDDGARVEGGNEFPSQGMKALRAGTDDGARVEVRFGVGAWKNRSRMENHE
jgi:hypothetical protein